MPKSIDKISAGQYRVEYDEHCTVEIGDGLSAKLNPEVKLKKWGDECWIKIKPQVAYTDNDPIEVGTGKIDKLEIADNTGDEALHIYPLDPGPGQHDGGLELEAVLNKKPASGPFIHKWDFEDSGNLKYCYQDYKTKILQ